MTVETKDGGMLPEARRALELAQRILEEDKKLVEEIRRLAEESPYKYYYLGYTKEPIKVEVRF